jgi:hypothetical protein
MLFEGACTKTRVMIKFKRAKKVPLIEQIIDLDDF